MPVTIDQAREAKQLVRQLVGANAGVVGIGLTRRGEDHAVKVNLSAPPDDELPGEVLGVPVVYEVVGPIRPRPV